MCPVSPICASTVEQTAELPCLWLPPRRRNGDCNRPTTSASAITNMWIPQVAEQCLFFHPLASLSDLQGHGVLVHGSGGFARCMFQPYAVREGLSLRQESILLIAFFLSSGVFQTSLVFLQLHDTVLSLSRQDLLINRSLLLLTLLDILSFNRAVHHSFTLHFFLLLHTRCQHIPSINSFEPWRSSH